jgi:heme exporter protein C
MKILKYILIFIVIPVQVTLALFNTPLVKGLGESTRVFYYHVPIAWLAVLSFLLAGYYSAVFLKNKNPEYDLKAEANARLGLLFSILATLSGSMWAKITWGDYWNWDPRETSILVLLIIYLAYFVLRSSIEQNEKRASLSAVYAIAAFATVPVLVFVIPRIYESLHPDPIVNERGKVEMSSTIRMIFFFSMITFTWIYFYLKKAQEQILILKNKKHTEILEKLKG